MKQIAPKALVIALCLSLGSCSWRHLFVIKNASEEAIQIRYQLTSLAEAGIFKDKVAVLDQKGAPKVASVLFDATTMTVSILLPPNAQAIIGDGRNTKYQWYKKRLAPDETMPFVPFFNLDYLEISNSKGSITVRKHMIETLITKNSAIKTVIKVK